METEIKVEEGTEVRGKIEKIIKDLKQVEEIPQDVGLLTSNFFDSFDIIRLIGELEKEFTIKIDGGDILLGNFDQVGSIVTFVEKLMVN